MAKGQVGKMTSWKMARWHNGKLTKWPNTKKNVQMRLALLIADAKGEYYKILKIRKTRTL